MSLLTTLLLIDAVEKGGPGSGPQGGPSEHSRKSAKAQAATSKAITSKDHKQAASLHRAAAESARISAANHQRSGQEDTGRALRNSEAFHNRQASFHDSMAHANRIK